MKKEVCPRCAGKGTVRVYRRRKTWKLPLKQCLEMMKKPKEEGGDLFRYDFYIACPACDGKGWIKI